MRKETTSLRRDLAIFADPGFLLTIAIVLLLLLVGAGVLVWGSETHGIPISPYWS